MTRFCILAFFFICLIACGEENKEQTTLNASPEVATDSYTNLSVGAIENACDLITKADVRLLPGFAEVEDLYKKTRNSPDQHTSVCEFLAKSQGLAFVLSYHKSAGNSKLIDDFVEKGYKSVEGIGQKAAFDRKKGYLKWIGENGVMVTAYIFPTTPQTVDAYYEALSILAKGIDKRFHNS